MGEWIDRKWIFRGVVLFMIVNTFQYFLFKFYDWSWGQLSTTPIALSISDLIFYIGLVLAIIIIVIGLRESKISIKKMKNI